MKASPSRGRTWAVLALLAACGAGRAEAAWFDASGRDTWAVLGGYGQSVPDWGLTEQRVETLDLVPRWSHPLFGIGMTERRWYSGFHSVFIETPVSLTLSPEVSSIVSVNVLAAWTFAAGEVWRPYIFGGGGPVYSFADIPGMGADVNGNYQFGLCLERRLESGRRLLLEARYHHISNAGSAEPNVPLNSWKLLAGLSF